MDKPVILTDADGVLLNWDYAFSVWIKRHGFTQLEGTERVYEIHKRYGMMPEQKKMLVRMFNESAAIGFLPPLRDAVHYIQKLHREHGYVFHVITSLSTDPSACELRTQNLKKLFGDTVFERFVYLDTGADKNEALEEYAGSSLIWVEDKPENARVGMQLGLDSLLMEHGHNINENLPIVKNWKEIWEYATGSV